MNAFEEIVAKCFEEEGYWVRRSVKVEISKQDKRNLGKPSMPRPEIDLVALNFKKNELLLVEVKSYLDSYGVYFEAVVGKDPKDKERYRLFWNAKYREIISSNLKNQYLTQGLINQRTKINYALAAGNIHYQEDDHKIRDYFSKQPEKWILITPRQIKSMIKGLSVKG
ncbi:MAG: hypothetical protein GH142_06620, partial [Dehalococcoidia bacterium]|nr:hypothetical protein [Dehalococcoidia bacterium]